MTDLLLLSIDLCRIDRYLYELSLFRYTHRIQSNCLVSKGRIKVVFVCVSDSLRRRGDDELTIQRA